MDILPLFKSHYSLGRSILTLDDEGEAENSKYPDSIIDIARNNSLKEIYLVEDNMSSFLEAYTNTKKYNIKLRYGLRISLTENLEDKSEESRTRNSKFLIFFKNEEGYKKLIKIFSLAAKSGFYYEPRIDFKFLKSNWDSNLILAAPFYDSFIFNNVLKGYLCAPQIDFTSVTFFIENNGLPFDSLIKSKVINYVENNPNNKIINTHTIFYNKKSDFKAYLTFRCINSRTTLNKPELEHMTSNEFCFEKWLEKNSNE